MLILLSNSLEYFISWGANSHVVDQGLPYLLWNQSVCYSVDKILPLDFILCQMNWVFTLTPCFFKIYFSIILLSGASKWCLSYRFSHWNLVVFLIFSCVSAHLVLLDLITLIIMRLLIEYFTYYGNVKIFLGQQNMQLARHRVAAHASQTAVRSSAWRSYG